MDIVVVYRDDGHEEKTVSELEVEVSAAGGSDDGHGDDNVMEPASRFRVPARRRRAVRLKEVVD